MKLQKENIRNVIKVVTFLMLLSLLFLLFTYLFRDTSQSKRQIILEYYTEPEDTLDVVMIGASNVIRYWDPMRAWNDYGIASYNYATSSMTAATYLAALQDALKTQTPELVVMEVRMFGRNYNSDQGAMGARHLLDCLDYNISRLQAAKYYSDTLGLSWKERLPLYIDLIYYHTNYEAMVTPLNWDLADNRMGDDTTKNKGYFAYTKLSHFEDPTSNLSGEIGELDENAEKFYVDILKYCQEKEIPVLLLATPIVIKKIESERFNALGQIAEEYGIPFLDTNLLYEEMGLDFSKDFSDAHHTNIFGADKFTDFFAEYLLENYDLPNRRNDLEYECWEKNYETYLESSNRIRDSIDKLIKEREQALQDGLKMQESEDLLEWLALADNKEFTLFLLAEQAVENEPSAESELLLKNFGVKESYWKAPFAVVYNEKVKQGGKNAFYSGKVGEKELEYTISSEGEASLQIDNIDYHSTASGDIQVLVYSNSLDQVYDHVMMSIDQNGVLQLKHIPVDKVS